MTTPGDPGVPVAFAWRDHGRFLEVLPVRTGWLVVWGRHDAAGKNRTNLGNRVYHDQAGIRRRIGDVVAELTGNRQEALDAMALFDRRGLPAHHALPFREPL